MDGVLVPGRTCFRRGPVRDVRLLVDARDYYAAFCEAALRAERTLLLSGWQFDTKVRLLRGEQGQAAEHPLELVEFLGWLCERTPSLDVYILAWDYSKVYAIEREWLQKLKFALCSHERVHVEYWTHPDPGGAQHQKYVVVDDRVAFIGGMDICDARWDDREHRRDHPERVDVGGSPCKPYHDVQAAFAGPLVRDVRALFISSWERACGEKLSLPEPLELPEPPKSRVDGLELRVSSAALCRTDFRPEEEGPTACEVRDLLEAAILTAERVIYVETQYFTSRAVLSAFRRRIEDTSKPKLVIVIVMPDGADSAKEDLVLGDRQRAVRFALAQLAAHHGHELRILVSRDESEPDDPVSTFIHSKLLIVDDELLTLGSANLSNRSMEVDMELNLTFQSETGSVDCPTVRDIRSIRASLLAEHAGVDDPQPFTSIDTLVEQIDRACGDPASKLQRLAIASPADDDPLLTSVFDPDGATLDSLEQCLDRTFTPGGGLVKTALRKVGQRLGVFDIE